MVFETARETMCVAGSGVRGDQLHITRLFQQVFYVNMAFPDYISRQRWQYENKARVMRAWGRLCASRGRRGMTLLISGYTGAAMFRYQYSSSICYLVLMSRCCKLRYSLHHNWENVTSKLWSRPHSNFRCFIWICTTRTCGCETVLTS